jgi:hypothetical protein
MRRSGLLSIPRAFLATPVNLSPNFLLAFAYWFYRVDTQAG